MLNKLRKRVLAGWKFIKSNFVLLNNITFSKSTYVAIWSWVKESTLAGWEFSKYLFWKIFKKIKLIWWALGPIDDKTKITPGLLEAIDYLIKQDLNFPMCVVEKGVTADNKQYVVLSAPYLRYVPGIKPGPYSDSSISHTIRIESSYVPIEVLADIHGNVVVYLSMLVNELIALQPLIEAKKIVDHFDPMY